MIVALLWVLGVVVYAVGSTLTFGFFYRRAETPSWKNERNVEGAVMCAFVWPFSVLFLVPAVLIAERIERDELTKKLRAEEEARLLKMADEELAREDRERVMLRRVR